MGTRTAISTLDREKTLDELERTHFDCLVIGGGITGAGIAREASRRGLSVAVLEAEDFGSGTSGRSSKLIHGGIRYLAQGDIALVRETALERKYVHRIAPHLAAPAWMVIPVRSRASLLKFRTAVATYEKLGAVESRDRHRVWNSSDLEENEPTINRDEFPRACVYREYVTDDARLVIANLRAAVGERALVIPHARIDRVLVEAGTASGAEGVCELSGRRVRVRARCVINAAGPWVEAVRKLEDPKASSVLHLSKGVHVVIPRERLPVNHLVILSAPDGRSVFCVPRGNIVYVGTTDSSYGKAPDVWPEITRSEVDYLLEPLSRYFPQNPVAPRDCVAAWSGLRPLVAQEGRKATEISRKDEVWRGPSAMISIAGGKLTGYRKMATGVLKHIEHVLGASFGAPTGEDGPLPGGDFAGGLETLAEELTARFQIEKRTARRLAELYGSESAELLALGAQSLVPGAPVVAGEVEWAIRYEGAATVEDVLYRRMRAALYEPECCSALVEPLGRQMASLLSWDVERRDQEIARANDRLSRDLDFAFEGEVQ
jgi:glycerol-3-phosphate dehydrogenase